MKRVSKTKAKPIIAIVGHPGRAKNGSDTEWLLAIESDMSSVGKGPKALAIAMAALYLLAKETSDIPMGKGQSDQRIRQWMLEITIHKAAITQKASS